MATANRILVPVDGSKCALRALRFAASRLDRHRGGLILLLNVQPPMPPGLFVTRDMIKEHQRRHADPIIKHAETMAKRLRIKTRSAVRVGDPAPLIARMARQSRCSEIVMGTRGRGRLAGAVLGSTSMKLLHIARIPVTLIR